MSDLNLQPRTMEERAVLRTLDERGGRAHLIDVSAELGLAPPNLRELLNRLGEDWVRVSGAGRAGEFDRAVYLTPEAQALLTALGPSPLE